MTNKLPTIKTKVATVTLDVNEHAPIDAVMDDWHDTVVKTRKHTYIVDWSSCRHSPPDSVVHVAVVESMHGCKGFDYKQSFVIDWTEKLKNSFTRNTVSGFDIMDANTFQVVDTIDFDDVLNHLSIEAASQEVKHAGFNKTTAFVMALKKAKESVQFYGGISNSWIAQVIGDFHPSTVGKWLNWKSTPPEETVDWVLSDELRECAGGCCRLLFDTKKAVSFLDFIRAECTKLNAATPIVLKEKNECDSVEKCCGACCCDVYSAVDEAKQDKPLGSKRSKRRRSRHRRALRRRDSSKANLPKIRCDDVPALCSLEAIKVFTSH